jgi:hypothetical protein
VAALWLKLFPSLAQRDELVQQSTSNTTGTDEAPAARP